MDGRWLKPGVLVRLSGWVRGKGDKPDEDVHFSLLGLAEVNTIHALWP